MRTACFPQMQTPSADTPVQYVPGVGPRRAEWFAAAGLPTVGKLLEYFPARYELSQGGVDIADLQPHVTATVLGDVTRVRSRAPALVAEITDGTDTLRLRWFQPPRAAGMLKTAMRVVVTGRVQVYNDRLEMVQPEISVYRPDAPLPAAAPGARLMGVYPARGELKSPLLRRAIARILENPSLPVETVVPAALLRKRGWPARADAVRAMHQPRDQAEQQRARNALAYEELLLLELAMALRRRRLLARETGQKLLVTPEIDRRIRARFPFRLTDAQNAALREIVRDLRSGQPMTRLVQGDVGCGKTVVALYACLVAVANRKQAAIMAPTEILAQQHFTNIERYLAGSRVRAVLLRGRTSAAVRGKLLAEVERGEVDLVVGTQALIQKDVFFRDLGLVVVDEQHKFGVLQRHHFRGKGGMPHYLVMTATPIPRTLAMSVFGDLDVSVIRSSPPGRGRIITRVTTSARWADVMAYARKRIDAGEQAYVVCPQIGDLESANEGEPPDAAEPSSTAELRGRRAAARPGAAVLSAIEVHERLARGPWKGVPLGLLHGALRSADARKLIGDFAAGELKGLVSTTIVEVGIDVPAATMMIIEHAERFGLSQLHQLRGRVGRGLRDSLCVLIDRSREAGRAGSPAAERLQVMADTTDGFRIAEADLRFRGPGQLFGTRQHGLPELRVASIVDDYSLLAAAREDAFALVAADPRLERPEHRPLWFALRAMFAGRLALIDAA